jgi:predicted transcriptional regulator
VVVLVRSPDESLQELRAVAQTLDAGGEVDLPSRLIFASMDQLLGVLTPNRWKLIQTLHKSGPASIRALARTLDRDYRGVHADVAKLLEHDLVARNADRKVYVPWVKITAEISASEEAA